MTTAQAIKKELKANFPSIKFSVTKGSGTASSSVNIDRVDGPTKEQVKDIANKYAYGKFDAMSDSRDVSNSRDDLPQVKYVMFSRMMSEETKQAITPIATTVYNEAYGENYQSLTLREFIRNIFRAKSIDGVIKSVEKTFDGSISESFKFVY